MKLITQAPGSPALHDYLRARSNTRWFTCRADVLRDAAIALTPAPRRTIDALHIAAALSAGPRLHALITYDTALATAAGAHHIDTTHPGGAP